MPQTKIILQCQECDSRNYVTSKNRQNVTDTLELRKHCPVCGKHTDHQETRIRK